jgi:hypothetical protein
MRQNHREEGGWCQGKEKQRQNSEARIQYPEGQHDKRVVTVFFFGWDFEQILQNSPSKKETSFPLVV